MLGGLTGLVAEGWLVARGVERAVAKGWLVARGVHRAVAKGDPRLLFMFPRRVAQQHRKRMGMLRLLLRGVHTVTVAKSVL